MSAPDREAPASPPQRQLTAKRSHGSEPIAESRYFVESAPGRPADAHPARAVLDPVLLPLVQTTLDVAEGRLARVWLLGPGDQCASCPMRSECGDQTRCLHLIASAGL